MFSSQYYPVSTSDYGEEQSKSIYNKNLQPDRFLYPKSAFKEENRFISIGMSDPEGLFLERLKHYILERAKNPNLDVYLATICKIFRESFRIRLIPLEFFYFLKQVYLENPDSLDMRDIRFLNEYYDSLAESDYEAEVGKVMSEITEYRSKPKKIIKIKVRYV